METTTVGEIQKNFAAVLRKIKAGEEIIVTDVAAAEDDSPFSTLWSVGAD